MSIKTMGDLMFAIRAIQIAEHAVERADNQVGSSSNPAFEAAATQRAQKLRERLQELLQQPVCIQPHK